VLKFGAAAVGLCLLAGAAPDASAQGRPDPATLVAAQREAMTQLEFMNGVWQGTAWTLLPSFLRVDPEAGE